MVVNGRSMKRMKRRVTADLSNFHTFPSTGDASVGPFRNSVRAFLSSHATLPPPASLFPDLLPWQILLRVGDLSSEGVDSPPAIICLDVVEEDVAGSVSVYCDQCRVVGWSGNPVCGKRYHFIIKADGGSIGRYHKSCPGCGDILHLSESRCKSCNYVMTTEDVEDWIYQQLDDTTHLLHGVVHANGYGHLLRVNGREAGSRVLSGTHILDFWDRLCKVLCVRKVSVMDVSKKYGLEYRLLHAIMKGHPWYGDWGYEFGSGSFGLTLDAYKIAVETLSGQHLSSFFSHARKPRTRLQDLISFYQSLSERELVNVRDLFVFLIGLIRLARKNPARTEDGSYKKIKLSGSSNLITWSINDIKRVEEAMFKVLRAVSGSNWVSYRALRGAVCKVGPPELLDFCLKDLKGKQTPDGLVVHARCSHGSATIEFRLEPGCSPSKEELMEPSSTIITTNQHPSIDHLLRDLRYLYESILHPYSMIFYSGSSTEVTASKAAATTILDCKQFVKTYNPYIKLRLENPSSIFLECSVELMEQFEEEEKVNIPTELLVLPANATVLDLKVEASKTFHEIYLMFRRFHAEEVLGFGDDVTESTQIKAVLGSCCSNGNGIESVRVRGKCVGKSGVNGIRTERGEERWTVDCGCGAKDDDGERMLACDKCGVWQHTRCAGIPDFESEPVSFVCYKCRNGRPTELTRFNVVM
ncbi:PHD finger protein At1g33420 [Impatiens glandulifera]|uniref:PHD finger protein At1g33420 n=1 Tax=Impatiens glandulifera TaxID=253017 RepID=UPI001FB15840|nr:PHD finger protein At1g33420 [Impatiens glandulifera]